MIKINIYLQVVEMLHWLLNTFGHDKTNPESKNYNYRLQRIYFSCLTFHISVKFFINFIN